MRERERERERERGYYNNFLLYWNSNSSNSLLAVKLLTSSTVECQEWQGLKLQPSIIIHVVILPVQYMYYTCTIHVPYMYYNYNNAL